MPARALLLSLAMLAALLPGLLLAEATVAVPPLTARVLDQTSTLPADVQAELTRRLASLEERKGSQLAVLIVATVRPEAIEQYAIRVVDAWQLGRKGVDDGVLLLVAKDDREVRIEVGRGLEGAIPDATANRVIDEYLLPRFREDDYPGGISAAVDRLIGLVDGEPLPAPTAAEPPDALDRLPFVFILALIFGNGLRKIFGLLPGALVTGALAGGVTWLLVGGPGLVLLMTALGFFIGLTAGRSGGSWASHGRGGGGSGGFGGRSGGGGFRGGGGGFGGGGASGRW